jgi:glycine/D-amino acid oxidase-like deaminating enzyme
VLTERGKDVALVERRHFPASGASGRNAGLVLVGTRDYYVEAIQKFGRDMAREIWTLTADNVARMRALSKQYGVEHQEAGASYRVFDDPVAEQLAESAKLLQRDGFDAEYLNEDPLG